MSSIETRVQCRGGKWGVRAFRLALACTDKDVDGHVTKAEIVSALQMYGVRGVSEEEVGLWTSAKCVSNAGNSAAYSSSTVPIHELLNSVVGPLSRDRIQCTAVAYEKMRREFAAGNRQPLNENTFPTLRFIVAEVNIVSHPDVARAVVSKRDALFCYYCAWGVDLDAAVSQELFMQFHGDLGSSFPTDAEFVRLIEDLYGITANMKSEAESQHPLVPSREDSDKLFVSLDAFKRKRLSLAELDLAVMRLWPTMNYKPSIMRTYKLVDTNGDGTLDIDEFYQFLHYLVKFNFYAIKFKALDTDNSRNITFDELRKGKKVLGLESCNDTALRAIFKQIDGNGGGKILFDEFCAFLAKREGDVTMSKTSVSVK